MKTPWNKLKATMKKKVNDRERTGKNKKRQSQKY